jgi:hypothetical protein
MIKPYLKLIFYFKLELYNEILIFMITKQVYKLLLY